MVVKYTYGEMLMSFSRSSVLDLVVALGYVRLKKICLDTLKNVNEDHDWLNDVQKITDLTDDEIKKKFQTLLYKFELLEANGWIYP